LRATHPDLNLLIVFEAIYHHRSLTRAGLRLGLSQPAVSAALARLRDLFADPLFVRTSHGVVPTRRAEEIAIPLEPLLDSLRQMMRQEVHFDPSKSTRSFRLLMPDAGELHILPQLVKHLRRVAPNTSIVSEQIMGVEQFRLLEEGKMDAAIGHWPDLPSERNFLKKCLFVDSFSCLVRRGNKLLSTRASRDDLARASHVVVSRSETSPSPTDMLLRSLGSKCRVAARVPHYMAVPRLLEGADLVSVMPTRLAATFAGTNTRLRTVALDFSMPAFDVSLYWHRGFAKDSALTWLLDTMTDLFRDTSAEKARR
jgi:DNA-binding transcriptional LysR family regulator